MPALAYLLTPFLDHPTVDGTGLKGVYDFVLDISPEDAARFGIEDGDAVRISSRRGSVVAPARIDRSLRAGLVFMTLHFQDEVKTNLLTVDATDPKSGTAEFKACAVRLEPAMAMSAAPARQHAIRDSLVSAD